MCKALEQIKQWAFEEGFAKGKQDGIQATVSILKGLQLDTELIQEKLMAAYSLTADEAQKYIQG